MALFRTDSVSLGCANLAAEKQWWIRSFDCKETKAPPDWDCPLTSDVALQLPGHDSPTILLSDLAEVRNAGYERPNEHTVIYCARLTKAHEWLLGRGVEAGPIQHSGGAEFFEVRDPEGNVIEICKEP